MTPADIKWLQVESSSRCNAWCPMCPRNNNGFGLRDGVVEEDVSTEKFQKVVEQLPNLELIEFCGNLGDPIIGKNFLELIDISKKTRASIRVHTNGSLRNEEWWTNFAKELTNVEHDILFGLDGLDGVHEIYRQGTNYQKIINNATAFIQAGGTAVWKFIPYAHNEHQIKDCLKLSQKLGFKKFDLIKGYRSDQQARHYKTGEPYRLDPPTTIHKIMKMPKVNTHVEISNCMHNNLNLIYMNASGTLNHCCFFGNIKSFDNVEELLYNTADLTRQRCIIQCGS